MQLDRTSIAIRERAFLDILDLALRVIRGHIGPLLLASLVGIVPFALLNQWLLGPTLVGENFHELWPGGYLWHMTLLIIAEIPLATAPITIYLGQVLFMQSAAPREIAHSIVARLPQLIVLQGLVRGGFAYLAAWLFAREADEPWLFFLGFFVVLIWFFLFAFWPYLNEILLLERNPLRRRNGSISTLSRSQAIHSHATSDLIGRWLASLAVGSLMLFTIWLSLVVVRTMLAFQSGLDRFNIAVMLMFSAWLLVVFFTVVRFLSYLDLRIRTEGWEIELTMRAEGARLTRQVS